MTYIIGGILLLGIVAWMLITFRLAWIRAGEMEARLQAEHVKKMAEREAEHQKKMAELKGKARVNLKKLRHLLAEGTGHNQEWARQELAKMGLVFDSEGVRNDNQEEGDDTAGA